MMKIDTFLVLTTLAVPVIASAEELHMDAHDTVSDQVIQQQRDNLANMTDGKGFGPQSPRDIDSSSGSNTVVFGTAPQSVQMNLCNIHFHKNAEHKGGEFTLFAGNGDGSGYQTGYKYAGKLTKAELTPVGHEICPSKHGGLKPGDTIETHYVYTTAKVQPGSTLNACFSPSIANAQLRVEAQVSVLVNDKNALDFGELVRYGEKNGYEQALGIPDNTGKPVQYSGSTTGPKYNEEASPFQVTWNVRPNVNKVNIETVGMWCEDNVFKEDHAHGVRNLIVNPELLAPIE